jgi:hypothetical protein
MRHLHWLMLIPGFVLGWYWTRLEPVFGLEHGSFVSKFVCVCIVSWLVVAWIFVEHILKKQ